MHCTPHVELCECARVRGSSRLVGQAEGQGRRCVPVFPRTGPAGVVVFLHRLLNTSLHVDVEPGGADWQPTSSQDKGASGPPVLLRPTEAVVGEPAPVAGGPGLRAAPPRPPPAPPLPGGPSVASPRPTLLVAVTTCNQWHLTDNLLGNLASLTDPIQVVIVDDSSEDGTADKARARGVTVVEVRASAAHERAHRAHVRLRARLCTWDGTRLGAAPGQGGRWRVVCR
jgi:hypothetical protein